MHAESVFQLLIFFFDLSAWIFLILQRRVLNYYLQPVSHKEYASSGILFSLCNNGRIIIIGMPNQTIRRCQTLKTRKNRPVNPTTRNQSRQDMTITCWLTTASSVAGENRRSSYRLIVANGPQAGPYASAAFGCKPNDRGDLCSKMPVTCCQWSLS